MGDDPVRTCPLQSPRIQRLTTATSTSGPGSALPRLIPEQVRPATAKPDPADLVEKFPTGKCSGLPDAVMVNFFSGRNRTSRDPAVHCNRDNRREFVSKTYSLGCNNG